MKFLINTPIPKPPHDANAYLMISEEGNTAATWGLPAVNAAVDRWRYAVRLATSEWLDRYDPAGTWVPGAVLAPLPAGAAPAPSGPPEPTYETRCRAAQWVASGAQDGHLLIDRAGRSVGYTGCIGENPDDYPDYDYAVPVRDPLSGWMVRGADRQWTWHPRVPEPPRATTLLRGMVPVRPARRGMLIAIEGPDGSGKTTLVRELADQLRATCTREPYDREGFKRYLEALRLVGLERRRVKAALCHLFTEDRQRHVDEVINPALERDEVVITDRWWLSTVACQGDSWEAQCERFGEPDLWVVLPRRRADAPAPDGLEVPASGRAYVHPLLDHAQAPVLLLPPGSEAEQVAKVIAALGWG